MTAATDVFARMQAVETSLQKVTDMLKVHSKDTGGSVPADAIVEEGAKAAKDETTEQSSDKENGEAGVDLTQERTPRVQQDFRVASEVEIPTKPHSTRGGPEMQQSGCGSMCGGGPPRPGGGAGGRRLKEFQGHSDRGGE